MSQTQKELDLIIESIRQVDGRIFYTNLSEETLQASIPGQVVTYPTRENTWEIEVQLEGESTPRTVALGEVQVR